MAAARRVTSDRTRWAVPATGPEEIDTTREGHVVSRESVAPREPFTGRSVSGPRSCGTISSVQTKPNNTIFCPTSQIYILTNRYLHCIMSIINDDGKTINRRNVLRKAGAAGVASVGFAALGSGTASAGCSFKFAVDDCVKAAPDGAIVVSEPCVEDAIGMVAEGKIGVVENRDCCGSDNDYPFYYIDWCDPDLTDGWVFQGDLYQSSECCPRS